MMPQSSGKLALNIFLFAPPVVLFTTINYEGNWKIENYFQLPEEFFEASQYYLLLLCVLQLASLTSSKFNISTSILQTSRWSSKNWLESSEFLSFVMIAWRNFPTFSILNYLKRIFLSWEWQTSELDSRIRQELVWTFISKTKSSMFCHLQLI